MEQLAHSAYPALPEYHIRREAGKAFSDGVEDPTIKIQLLQGGQKTVNDAIRQALELEAVLLAASPQKGEPEHSGGVEGFPPGLEDQRPSMYWSLGSQTTFWVKALMEERQ
jgi:hypothetical protein